MKRMKEGALFMVQVFERVLRKVCGWRRQVVEQGVLRVETLLLLALCVGLFLAGGGFFFGRSCSGWPMWLGFGGVFGFAWVCDWRRALGFLGVAGVIWVLTAWTFSYTGTDSIAYHLPMQRLLHGGWNPVLTHRWSLFGRWSRRGGAQRIIRSFCRRSPH